MTGLLKFVIAPAVVLAGMAWTSPEPAQAHGGVAVYHGCGPYYSYRTYYGPRYGLYHGSYGAWRPYHPRVGYYSYGAMRPVYMPPIPGHYCW